MNKEIEEIDQQIKAIDEKLESKDLAKGTATTLQRVSGYYRSTTNFNVAKRAEVVERQTYALGNAESMKQKHGINEDLYKDHLK